MSTTSSTVGSFLSYMFPVVKASYPTSITSTLTSVQPMNPPTRKNFTIGKRIFIKDIDFCEISFITDVFFAIKDGKNIFIKSVDDIQDPALKPFFFIRFTVGAAFENMCGHIVTNLDEWYTVNEDLYQSIFNVTIGGTSTTVGTSTTSISTSGISTSGATGSTTINTTNKPKLVINNLSKDGKNKVINAINNFMSGNF